MRKTDALGLATEMCRRKLDNVPFSVGPLFHQYICIPDGKGGKACGGLGASGGVLDALNTPGKMEYENSKRPGASCEKVEDDDTSIEQCIAEEMKKADVKPPNYSLDLSKGENCQSWANAVVAMCQAKYRRRK